MSIEKTENVFFGVIEDLRDYLPDLTLVGGWMPFVYSRYLWKTAVKTQVTTVDIDFGVDQTISRNYPRTIFQTLTSLNYRERHMAMDRMFPVVLYKGNVPVEFITYPDVDIETIEKMVGRQIHVNKIDRFDFLLDNRIPIDVSSGKRIFRINCPRPSAFLYHKGATFIERENNEKKAKDLYYMYFIMRFAPDIESILQEISQYAEKRKLPTVSDNMNKYFERISSQGCLLVEQENGIDEFIREIRQDIFDRFKRLREALSAR
ncbi:MAG: nucleotidyltransferase domain-containing protein [Candidatus Krumholzibacteria bacterium]|jgi:hypothetical protein|nr:nucleotidyltransferase domain-containing protein [Candidatus Krumholzibacteria bacterium]